MSPEASKPEFLLDRFCIQSATLCGVGFIPKLPGTAASLLTIPLAYGLAGAGWIIYVSVTLAVTLLAIPICGRAERLIGVHDPSCVVLDEVSGMLISFAPFSSPAFSGRLNPFCALLIVFLWFRFFDIRKPGPIRRAQQFRGGAGIVADDTLAGLFSAGAGVISWWILSAVL